MSECTVPVRTGCAECDQADLKVLMADIENWEDWQRLWRSCYPMSASPILSIRGMDSTNRCHRREDSHGPGLHAKRKT